VHPTENLTKSSEEFSKQRLSMSMYSQRRRTFSNKKGQKQTLLQEFQPLAESEGKSITAASEATLICTNKTSGALQLGKITLLSFFLHASDAESAPRL